VNRQLAILLVVIIVVVGGISVFLISRPKPEPASAPVSAAPAPTVAPPSAPAPAPVDTPRPTRRAAAPPPAAAPPAPIEAPPPADLVTLHIDSDVPGAQVFIDRQFVGAAPVTTSEVKPGTHQINVSAPGYDGYAQSIDVSPGPRDIMVRFKEVRLDMKAEVIHKHGIGSCRGTLVATAQGLRYDTTNKGDAFTVPLANLEAFQIDYLEKNLKVKVKNGKQYNFTDPEGNADHLFVFQRDVDKARQRLLKGDQAATN
jgi:PEGA domain-containing protein